MSLTVSEVFFFFWATRLTFCFTFSIPNRTPIFYMIFMYAHFVSNLWLSQLFSVCCRQPVPANHQTTHNGNGSVPTAGVNQSQPPTSAYDNPTTHGDTSPPPQYDDDAMTSVFATPTSQFNDRKLCLRLLLKSTNKCQKLLFSQNMHLRLAKNYFTSNHVQGLNFDFF